MIWGLRMILMRRRMRSEKRGGEGGRGVNG